MEGDVSCELTDAELEAVAAGKVGPSGVLFPRVGWPGWFRPRDRWPLDRWPTVSK